VNVKQQRHRHWLKALSIVVGVAAGCATSSREPGKPQARAPALTDAPAILEATLPEPPSGALAPSLARLVDRGAGAEAHAKLGETIADVEACVSCHADVGAQWRKSAHAFASFNNPVYRVVVERLRKDRGDRTSHFCGGCHDVALLVDGAMLSKIEPGDLRAHAGITCSTCHGISGTRTDGNGSWDLDVSPVPMPRDGDDASRLRHRARVGRASLRTAAMCSTCHKAFLDGSTGNASHLIGQDDATPWERSAFAGSHGARVDDAVPEKDCRGCHMPRVPAVLGDPGAKNGTVASHFFLGGHTWLASMQNDPELVEKARAFMSGRVTCDIGGVRSGEGRHAIVSSKPVAIEPGQSATVDVVLRNLDVGHRFPGGVMDAQDTWVEIVVDDARGRRIADAGLEQEASGADPTAHTLSAYMANASGARLMVRETHEFRAGVYNHTIPPRDAAVIGYAFTAPKDLAAYPLRVSARLRHRSRNLDLQKAACADFRSERGRTFGRVGLKKVARAIDACRPQPVTDLARTEILLSTAAAPVAARPDEARAVAFQRRYAYGLGLSHALQEHLDDARLPLAAALELASSPRERAMALGVLAGVASRQGRTEETFALADRVDAAAREASMPPPPAMQRARAEVLSSTWRLSEAAPLFLDVARVSPRDDTAWAQAAVTLGGAGEPLLALDTAKRGLTVQPRDGDMLRAQALALTTLHADANVALGAEAAFLERRTPDDAPGIRGKCSAKVPGCANERVPVHVHVMRTR
jgi:cytochrome c553